MLDLLASPGGLVGLLSIGFGLMALAADRRSSTTRALFVMLVALGIAVILDHGSRGGVGVEAARRLVDGVSLIAGLEWARRIGRTGESRWHSAASWTFHAGQLLTVVYVALLLGYIAIAPESATTDQSGAVRIKPIEWAIFAPVLSSAMGCAVIAIGILLAVRIDRAEAMRLRALVLATPFMLGRLVFDHQFGPLALLLGLLILMAGNVRYLVLMTRRGQFMQQFLAPAVAERVQRRGSSALAREQREVSAVMVDLRGFTSYAAARDSAEVFAMLERFYAAVGSAAVSVGATIKDHAGDGVLLLLGAPANDPEHAAHAVELARALGGAWRAERNDGVAVGVGVASGVVTVGTIRGANRLEYAAVGTPINLAARLCDLAGPGDIVVAASTAAAAGCAPGHDAQPRQVTAKGLPAPIEVLVFGGQAPAS